MLRIVGSAGALALHRLRRYVVCLREMRLGVVVPWAIEVKGVTEALSALVSRWSSGVPATEVGAGRKRLEQRPVPAVLVERFDSGSVAYPVGTHHLPGRQNETRHHSDPPV